MPADGRGHGLADGLARGRQRQLPREGEPRLEQAQGLAPRAVVQPEVADFSEALGQHVLEEAADELVRRDARGAGLAGRPVAVSEDDLLSVVAQDRGVGERHAEDVAGEVGQRLLPRADGLGVDDPRPAPDGGRDLREERGVAVRGPEIADVGGAENTQTRLDSCVAIVSQ